MNKNKRITPEKLRFNSHKLPILLVVLVLFPTAVNAVVEIKGANTEDQSGHSLSGAGDVNGDGFLDIVIGAPWASPGDLSMAGTTYIIYGKATMPDTIELASLTAAQGVKINGEMAIGNSARSLAVADVNDDGFDDVIIGATNSDPDGRNNAGITYIIYGSATMPATIELASLTAAQGVKINGEFEGDLSGHSVCGADVNGDGIADVILGAPYADRDYTDVGMSYVVYGNDTMPATIELASLTAAQGVKITGAKTGDFSGFSVSAADVNNDGHADVIIGAYKADPGYRTDAGTTYVIYGNDTMPATIELASLTADQGVKINGAIASDRSGHSVSRADVNDDGIDDVIIGAPYASPGGRTQAGTTYVVYGSATMPTAIELASLTSSQGVKINGALAVDYSGYSVSGAGDVNKDGFDDVVIGAPLADPEGLSNAGTTYIIYGNGTMPATIELASLTSAQGVKINNALAGGQAGIAVSGAGDMNGDGYDDVLIGASQSKVGTVVKAGMSYVFTFPITYCPESVGITCDQSLVFTSSGAYTCNIACPADYYYSGSSSTVDCVGGIWSSSCTACPAGCATCTSDDVCGTCKSGFALVDNVCVDDSGSSSSVLTAVPVVMLLALAAALL